MGVLKVIIEEDLYDKEFVERWTIGFDNIREEITKFTLDDVEKMTWVAKSQIQELARLYATTKPASIQEGNSLEFFANTFSTFRTTSILRAVTGNVNRPGSDVFLTRPKHARPGTLMLLGKVGRDKDKMLATDLSAARRWSYTPYQYLHKANLEGKPYPLKAVICCLTNPVVSYPDSQGNLRSFDENGSHRSHGAFPYSYHGDCGYRAACRLDMGGGHHRILGRTQGRVPGLPQGGGPAGRGLAGR